MEIDFVFRVWCLMCDVWCVWTCAWICVSGWHAYVRTCTLPEVNAGRTLIIIGLINLTDTAFWEENTNKRWIIAFWPIFYWKRQWIRVVLRWIWKFHIPMHWNLKWNERPYWIFSGENICNDQFFFNGSTTYSCVVETKSIKWQLKIEVFVELWVWCMNISLIVASVVVSAFIKIPIQEIFSKLCQTGGWYAIALIIVLTVLIAVLVLMEHWRFTRCHSVVWI